MTEDAIKQADINNAAWAACDTLESELVDVRAKTATLLREVAA